MGNKLGVVCECGLIGACLLIGLGCFTLQLVLISMRGIGVVD